MKGTLRTLFHRSALRAQFFLLIMVFECTVLYFSLVTGCYRVWLADAIQPNERRHAIKFVREFLVVQFVSTARGPPHTAR